MTHPFPVKVVALQAGVSVATVDRVIKRRGGVHANTVRRVMQALDELGRQSAQVGLSGKKFMIDVLMVAPQRFTDAVRLALEAELPSLHPAVLRSRFHLHVTLEADGIVELLERIRKNGSHGVLLKAPDLPVVVAAVGRLLAAGIPVVTLVTDLPGSARSSYVGMDNRAAGETAAYLIGQWMGRACQVFIGHDLDADNRALLQSGAVQAVLHHDLGQDMRRACQDILRARGALPPLKQAVSLSAIQIVTPWNLPALAAMQR